VAKIVWNGKSYNNYPERGPSGLYFRRSNRKEHSYLHRDIWEFHNGPIPEGNHVHHKDGNRNSGGRGMAWRSNLVTWFGAAASTSISKRANWSDLRSCTRPVKRVGVDSSAFRKSKPPVRSQNSSWPSTPPGCEG
jgi:hypothetical protein